jgi:hypothetical protein
VVPPRITWQISDADGALPACARYMIVIISKSLMRLNCDVTVAHNRMAAGA